MKPLFSLEIFYAICGLVVLAVAVGIGRDQAHPTRWSSAAFWFLFGATFLLGKLIPPFATGCMLLVMVALAALNRVRKSEFTELPKEVRLASAERLGNRIFLPAAVIPALVVVFYLIFKWVKLPGERIWATDPTVVALSLAALCALVVGIRLTRSTPLAPLQEGSRLLQTVGWALVLPQMLAALGGIFAKAGVGAVVSDLVSSAFPTQIPFVAVLAYCVAMALFTMAMGNAFAAFAVITQGIGLPFIVQEHGGNPAIMAALGMLSGYCGTLCTPMAANFNLVPAMLLELDDKYAVIKAQLPMAAAVFAFNVLMMWALVYRF